MTYFILTNPHSGAERGARTLEVLLPYLDKNNLSYQLFTTQKMGDEPTLIKKILSEKKETDDLLIIGGDGTLCLSVSALPEKLAFSYIPSGSGNDFARSLGLSFDPIENFKSIEKKTIHDIFIIKYASQFLNGVALNNIGIGLDAQIVKSTNSSNLKTTLNWLKMGKFAYLLIALGVLFSKKPFSVEVTAFDETVKSASLSDKRVKLKFNRAFLMTFTKHPYFGGGIKIAPNASSDNDRIHLVEFDRMPLLQIFPLIPKLLKGRHLKDPRFTHHVSTAFVIKSHETQPVQIDGETYQIHADDLLQLSVQKRKIIF